MREHGPRVGTAPDPILRIFCEVPVATGTDIPSMHNRQDCPWRRLTLRDNEIAQLRRGIPYAD